MLSASVEISLVYQVTSPLACPPEDDASKFADEEEQSGVDAARWPGGLARRAAVDVLQCSVASARARHLSFQLYSYDDGEAER